MIKSLPCRGIGAGHACASSRQASNQLRQGMPELAANAFSPWSGVQPRLTGAVRASWKYVCLVSLQEI